MQSRAAGDKECVLCLVVQLCPTLCDRMDSNPPGSSVHGFLRQEYWSELPCPPPGDLPNPGIKPGSPALQADSLPAELPDFIRKVNRAKGGGLVSQRTIFSKKEFTLFYTNRGGC